MAKRGSSKLNVAIIHPDLGIGNFVFFLLVFFLLLLLKVVKKLFLGSSRCECDV